MDTRPATSKTLELESHDLPQPSFSKKKALIVSMTLVLAVAAIVGACAVVALVTFPAGEGTATSQQLNPGELSLLEKEKLHSMVVANDQMASIARRQRRVQKPTMKSYCYSNITNDTIPMAHVSGTGARGIQWSEEVPFKIVAGKIPLRRYQTTWECNHQHDMVVGGMNFSKETQELIFPTCGVYYFSSQVMFQYPDPANRPNNVNKHVQHKIEITPNCGSSASYFRNSYSNLAEKVYQRTSTYLSDIVQMCEGGTIRIVIPVQHSLCCAHGSFMDTFFSSFLVQKTTCKQ